MTVTSDDSDDDTIAILASLLQNLILQSLLLLMLLIGIPFSILENELLQQTKTGLKIHHIVLLVLLQNTIVYKVHIMPNYKM